MGKRRRIHVQEWNHFSRGRHRIKIKTASIASRFSHPTPPRTILSDHLDSANGNHLFLIIAAMSSASSPDTNDGHADNAYLQQQQYQQHAFRPYDFGGDSTLNAQRTNSNGSNAAAAPAPKVAIPKNGSISLKREGSENIQSPAGESSEMTAKRSGPMSANITVPPRPRPGRKPIAQEDAQDRRRFQNRLAQRQFRDKRARKNVELEETLKEKTTEFHRIEGELRNTVAQLEARVQEMNAREQEREHQMQELRAENERLQAAVRQATSERDQAKRSNVGQFRDAAGQPSTQSHDSYGPGAGTPNSTDYEEQDFTNYGKSNYALQNSSSNESNQMDFAMENDHCGFCTDDGNCACKSAELEKVQQKTKPTPIEPRISWTAPGSCDMCQSDPERARACKAMAEATRPADKEATRTPSIFASTRPNITNTAMPPPQRMSCSEMVDAFKQHHARPSSIQSLFGGRHLTAYPSKIGYDLDQAEAAEVLTTLGRRSTDSVRETQEK